MAEELPWEIIFQEILPRVPAKTLIQNKCVSKDWYTSISPSSPDSFFIKTHLDFWKSRSSNGVIQQPSGDECYTFHDEETGEHFNLELHKLFNDRKILIPFASYDGLLLVQSIDYGNTRSFPSYYVCNPITRQFTKLPHPPFWLNPSEISFDPITFKYKVVSWSNQQGCAIFTLGDGDGGKGSSSWKLVPLPSDVGDDMYTRGVSVNGALYWVSTSISCSRNEPVSSSRCFILCLDMNKEEIKKINMPTEEEYDKPPILVEFKGGLYAVFNSEENLKQLVIWELDDWKKYIWIKITKKCSSSEYVYTCVATIVARGRLKLQNGILPLRRKGYQYCLDHVNSLVSWDVKAFQNKSKWYFSRGCKLVSCVMFYLFFVFRIYPVVAKG